MGQASCQEEGKSLKKAGGFSDGGQPAATGPTDKQLPGRRGGGSIEKSGGSPECQESMHKLRLVSKIKTQKCRKKHNCPKAMVHTFDPSTWEPEASGSL